MPFHPPLTADQSRELIAALRRFNPESEVLAQYTARPVPVTPRPALAGLTVTEYSWDDFEHVSI